MMEVKAKWNNSDVWFTPVGFIILWVRNIKLHIFFRKIQLAAVGKEISNSRHQKKQIINFPQNLTAGHKMYDAFMNWCCLLFLETWAWDICAVGSFSTWWPVETLNSHKFAMSSHHHLVENVLIFAVKGIKVYYHYIILALTDIWQFCQRFWLGTGGNLY